MAFYSFAADTLADVRVRPTKKPGILARLVHTLQASRQRQADLVIARHLERYGTKFTDSLEREIERVATGRMS